MRHIVGDIQGYNVVYIPEKDIIFCKNTTIKREAILQAINSKLDRVSIEEKNLTICKDRNLIVLGCLNTTKQNINNIIRNIENGNYIDSEY